MFPFLQFYSEILKVRNSTFLTLPTITAQFTTVASTLPFPIETNYPWSPPTSLLLNLIINIHNLHPLTFSELPPSLGGSISPHFPPNLTSPLYLLY